MRPLALVVVASALLGACATKAKLIAQGGECFQATDCADGLVCVPQTDGRHICDNDLTAVQSTEAAAAPPRADAGRREAGPEGGARDAAAPQDSGGDAGGADAAGE